MKTKIVAMQTYDKWARIFQLLVLSMLVISMPMLFGESPPVLAWSRLYGGSDDDKGYDVQQTFDKGYIVVGYTTSFGAGLKDVYLIKTDVNGDSIWTETYGGAGDDYGYAVQQTDDLGYIIAGYTNSFGGQNDIYLIKTDADGNVLWTRFYGGSSEDYAYDVQQTDDLGYIIVGYTFSFGAGLSDVYLIRTDLNGDTIWTKTYGGSELDVGISVQQTDDLGYIIAGSTNSFGNGGSDMYLIKTDANGDTLWTETRGTIHNEVANSVQQTTDLGYIVAGYMQKIGGEDSDLYLLKTDDNGGTDWELIFDGPKHMYGYSVDQTTDEGYIVGGYTNVSGGEDGDLYLLRIDSLGDSLWWKAPQSIFTTRIYSVQQTPDGYGYIVCGYSDDPKGNGGEDVWLQKYKYETVSIREEESFQRHFYVFQSGSNSFKDQTVIIYELPKASNVNISIYNHIGQAVRTLFDNEVHQAGTHTVIWDSKDNKGKNVPSGIYFLRVIAGDLHATKKLIKLE